VIVDVGSRRARASGRRAIPTADARALAPAARRMRVLLVLLPVLALAAAAWLAVAPRDTPALPEALRGGDPVMVVIDVSSSTLGYSHLIAQSLLALGRDPAQKAGLVLASDIAYIALPADAPGSALNGWQRLISFVAANNRKIVARAKQDRTPVPSPTPGDYPWAGVFTGGTRLSSGLVRATQALVDAGARHGQVVLISDLRDAPEDLPRVSAAISRLHELGMTLRVVVVGNAPRDRKAFSDKGGADFVIGAADAVYAPTRPRTLPSAPPALALVLLGLAVAALLGAVELLLPPLRWGRARPATEAGRG
jgi:hypothetical protein